MTGGKSRQERVVLCSGHMLMRSVIVLQHHNVIDLFAWWCVCVCVCVCACVCQEGSDDENLTVQEHPSKILRKGTSRLLDARCKMLAQNPK